MTMGVALPRWMVRKENTYFMLFLYMCLLLAIVSAVYYVMTTIRKSKYVHLLCVSLYVLANTLQS